MSGMFVYVDHNREKMGVTFHVPLRVTNKVITLWTAPTSCRYFTRENLPNFIKQKLAMIATLEPPTNSPYLKDKIDFEEKQHRQLRAGAYYASKEQCPEQFRDVGWRVNDKYYYIVLTEEEVMPLTMQTEEWYDT